MQVMYVSVSLSLKRRQEQRLQMLQDVWSLWERLEQAQYRDDNDDNINKKRINKCEYLQGSGALLMRAIHGLPSLILTRNLYCRYHYYPHPTDEKTEAQGSGNFLNIT